uniref:Uncharacterized protein n=1 Tax=Dunaliella tertiolecta TaxID=3047 RepID=A0A7S3QNK1_DUNTE
MEFHRDEQKGRLWGQPGGLVARIRRRILDLPHTASCSLLFEDIAASPSSRLAELSIAEEGPTTFVLSSTALQSRPSTLQRRSTWNHQARDSAHAAHSPGSARPVLRQSTATQTSSLTVSSRLCGSVHDGKQESNVLSKSLPNSHDNTLSKGSAAQLAAKLASKHSSFKASSAVLSKPVLLRPQDRSVSTSGSKDSGGNHSGSDSLDKRGTLTNTAAVSGIIKASGTLARAQAHLGAAQLSHGSNHSSSHGGHGVRAHAGFAQPDKRSLFKPSGRRIQTH